MSWIDDVIKKEDQRFLDAVDQYAAGPERKFLLRYEKGLAPGDYVVASALLRDIQLTYGSKYQVCFETSMGAIYQANPHFSPMRRQDPSVEVITLGYFQGMESSSSGNRHHFLSWLHRDFAVKTRIPVTPKFPRPDIHLTEEEKNTPPVSGKYWLVFGGGKSDVTTKHWEYSRYQEVVNRLHRKGLRFAQSGATVQGHIHPLMENALNLVGWGYLRELLWQIYHCEGVICPITAAMHIAAAFEKPCVVIAGGREEPWWEAYNNDYGQFGPDCEPVRVPHRYLHTVGTDLTCCAQRGCWKNKVVKIDKDQSVCTRLAERPSGAQVLPECMHRISVEDVCDAVMSYYENGTLDLPVDPTIVAEPQILADEVPWQPMASGGDKQPIIGEPRRGTYLAEPKLGGKLTICVGCIGQYDTLQQRCLDSIMRTVPPVRMDLRVGMAGVTDQLKTHVYNNLPATKYYCRSNAISKYELMRQMLWDDAHPIDTNYVAWFDDSCWVVNTHWLNELATTILKQPTDVAMFGVKASESFICPPDVDPRPWLQRQPWHRGKPLRTVRGTPAPNGDTIHYCESWFWVLRVDAMRQCDIPDVSVKGREGDIVIGEQLYQGGFKIMSFNVGRSLIFTPGDENQIKPAGLIKYPWR